MTSIIVDLVYTWVDSSDTCWLSKRNKYNPPIMKENAKRWETRGEIYSSIASVYKFAPWINRIFIIVDDIQRIPDRLTHASSVTIVRHKEIFGEEFEHCLPVFNSHAIEAHIHKINGLSEYFIYANDDVFFGAPCSISDFFYINANTGMIQPKIFNAGWKLPQHMRVQLSKKEDIYKCAQYNSYKSVLHVIADSSLVDRWSILHQVKPLSKHICAMGWKLCSKILEDTSSHRLRSVHDCSPIDLFLKLGQAYNTTKRGQISNYYTHWFNDSTTNKRMLKYLCEKHFKLYCINDIGTSNDPRITDYLTKLMPHCITLPNI